MNAPPPPPPETTKPAWARRGNVVFAFLCLAIVGTVAATLWNPRPMPMPESHNSREFSHPEFRDPIASLNAAFETKWRDRGLQPAPQADDFTIIRRLSLGLTGTVPSFEEVRAIQKATAEDRVQWWLSYLFEDRRYSYYLAERFARAYVGVENGPFLIYRRRRMSSWLSDEINANRPYDQIVRSLVAGQGVWTSQPEVNFITATVMEDPETKKNRPNEIKLAARTTRAFLGVRIDCVQCHDDMFGDHWKQEHFHQLAAFYAESDTGLRGVQDDTKRNYEYRYLDEEEKIVVPAIVPFNQELVPKQGHLRERLAGWITHPENRAFARTTVNRLWAMMFNKPMLTPIDDIPLEGPYPPGMEVLADELIRTGFNLQHVIRMIAASRPFQLDSKSADSKQPVTETHEFHWAAYPLTRLRPDQVIGSVMQSTTLRTINADAHIFKRAQSYFGKIDFVKRFGDFGEDEFGEHAGTIPQRLLMMNGNIVQERTGQNPFMNASSRISVVAPNDKEAIRTAFYCTLTREPTKNEAQYFASQIEGKKGDVRNRAMSDLFWALLNSTEFSWNH